MTCKRDTIFYDGLLHSCSHNKKDEIIDSLIKEFEKLSTEQKSKFISLSKEILNNEIEKNILEIDNNLFNLNSKVKEAEDKKFHYKKLKNV